VSGLDAAERAALDALFDCLFPPDARGPGAVLIGAADYVAAALEGRDAANLPAYRALLAALGPEPMPEAIAAWEGGGIAGAADFEVVWRHLREGLFADPAHGGNRDMLGWRLIGFPGAQFGYTAAEQALDAPVTRTPRPRAALPQPARPSFSVPRVAPLGEAEGAEVIVIGGGLAGMAAAWAFATAGRSVLVLEAGPARTGREAAMDEFAGTSVRNLEGEPKYRREVPSWRRNATEDAAPIRFPQGLANGLGGNTVPWGAVAHRFHPGDFRARSETLGRYGAAAIPEGTLLDDWPFDYEALEPWYDLAERVLGVSGGPGNPFDGKRANPYPMPPLRRSGLGALFAGAAGDLGLHPFALPAAIATVPWRGRHACTYCSFCSRFGCHVEAKASVQNALLPLALATGRVQLACGAEVLRILTDDVGRAIGVELRDVATGRTRQLRAGTVILAAYALESVRLLHLSRGLRHPDGIGNAHGMLGRGYMTRQQPAVFARFAGRRLNRFIGPTAQAVAVDDFNADHFDHAGLGFVRGGRIACFNQYLPIEASGILPPEVPRWGEAWRRFVLDAFHETAMLFIDPEILPYHRNTLDLDPSLRGHDGRPVLRITFDIGENERRLIPFLQDRARAIAHGMGASAVWARPPLTGPISTHDVGGARMSADPARGVTDHLGRVHDTEGLMVLGGALFPTLPGLNPALTILATALRGAALAAGLAGPAALDPGPGGP
jgi:gluconate 2-dehydrogenase alpha chain